MRILILIGILIVCLTSCKKDEIPNPLYGEWKLTEWIFEGRDITDSIEVIWGEEAKFFFNIEFVTFAVENNVTMVLNDGTRNYIGVYNFKTDDLNYIGISIKNRNYILVDSLTSERYAMQGINGTLLPAELFFNNKEEFLMYILVGGSQLNFIKL